MENPTNRYETVLTRRSIRKHTNGVQREQKEGVGDISLGITMKIINGKVIVKHVKSELIDGSATPASSRSIQRGDVILSLNGTSLVAKDVTATNKTNTASLLIDQILNTPNQDGVYEKTVHLELARGEGLKLLDAWDKAEEKELKEESTNKNTMNASSSGRRRSYLFGRRGSAAPAAPTEEGYATLETDYIPDHSARNNRRVVGGAAALAGMAGLVLMGPVTAVAAAGGAAFVAHKKHKERQNSTSHNIG